MKRATEGDRQRSSCGGFPQISPVDFRVQLFAAHAAGRQPLNHRTVLGWNDATVFLPLPDRAFRDAEFHREVGQRRADQPDGSIDRVLGCFGCFGHDSLHERQRGAPDGFHEV